MKMQLSNQNMLGSIMKANIQKHYKIYDALGMIDKRSKIPKFKASIFDKRKKDGSLKPSFQKKVDEVELKSKSISKELKYERNYINIKR